MRFEKKPISRRFRFRYSRTTILVVSVLVLCFIVTLMYRAAQQRQTVQSFYGRSASFFYNFEVAADWDEPFKKSSDVYEFKTRGKSPLPEWFLYTAGLDFCHTVVGCDVLARDIKQGRSVENLKQLKFLNITNWSGPDSGIDTIDFLAGHTQLQALSLYGNKQLSNVDALANMKRLRYVNLSNTNVANLTPLMNLNELQVLRVHSTPIETAEFERFRQAHPNCIIEQQR